MRTQTTCTKLRWCLLLHHEVLLLHITCTCTCIKSTCTYMQQSCNSFNSSVVLQLNIQPYASTSDRQRQRYLCCNIFTYICVMFGECTYVSSVLEGYALNYIRIHVLLTCTNKTRTPESPPGLFAKHLIFSPKRSLCIL